MRDRTHNNIGYWCRKAVEEHANEVAIIDLCGAQARDVTYRELDQRLNRFANLITRAGLGPGDRMAMAVDNRFEFVEVMYGAMRAGVVPVPLNTRQGRESLSYIVRDAGCRGAVVEPACNEFIVDVIEELGDLPRFAFDPAPQGWQHYETALMGQASVFEPPEIDDDHPSFQPYTSGSTGRPKGVVLTHVGQLWWIGVVQKYWPSGPDSRALAAVPLYHKNAMAGAIKPLLHAGGSVVLLPNFEPRRFLETLAHYRCTQAGSVPAVFTLLLQHKDLIASLDFSALRGLKIGSAPVQEELMQAVQDAFGCEVGESYGLTEGGPVMFGSPLDGRKVPFGSCGVAWPEGEIKLIAPDGRENPRHGELWVKNPGVTPGYYNLPEVNAKQLKDGWLATGDLFRVDEDGFYYFLGRTDDMFNSGGENIYPKEVENLLLSHPEVFDASVVPVAHPVKGHVPVAMVMRKVGANLTEDELKRFCLKNGPAYSHPRRIMVVEEMPLSGAAKVDRTVIQARLEAAFAADLSKAT